MLQRITVWQRFYHIALTSLTLPPLWLSFCLCVWEMPDRLLVSVPFCLSSTLLSSAPCDFLTNISPYPVISILPHYDSNCSHNSKPQTDHTGPLTETEHTDNTAGRQSIRRQHKSCEKHQKQFKHQSCLIRVYYSLLRSLPFLYPEELC